MRLCGINTGTEFHLLDHIAPLAFLMKMPLIVTEEINYKLSKKYYPQVKTLYEPDLEFKLAWLAEEFDALFECRYWGGHLKELFQTLYGKSMRLVFCPHGQSDKGFRHPTLAPYKSQDAVLLYGDLMIDMLKELGCWPSISSSAVVGNYRSIFYEKHRQFYDDLAKEELPLNKKNKTLLYAPTWNDSDGATTFFEHGKEVIRSLPSDWNLILRVHPLLEQRDPALFYSIAAEADTKPNAFLLGEFPPVYPVLALADVYLGDASSVGYDFLYFQKPMFSFPDERGPRLQSCGTVIDPEKNIYLQIDTKNGHVNTQKELYQFAFNASISEDLLRANILKEILNNSFASPSAKIHRKS